MKPNLVPTIPSGLTAPLLLIFFLLTGCIEKEITPEQQKILVTKSDLESYGIVLSEVPKVDKFSRKEYLSGSTLLKYEYTSAEKDPNVGLIGHLVYMSSAIKGAEKQYDSYVKVGVLDSDLGKRSKSLDHVFRYGSKSSFRKVVDESGNPGGNLFIFLKGKTAGMLILIGLSFEELDQWESFIRPKLDALEAYAATR